MYTAINGQVLTPEKLKELCDQVPADCVLRGTSIGLLVIKKYAADNEKIPAHAIGTVLFGEEVVDIPDE